MLAARPSILSHSCSSHAKAEEGTRTPDLPLTRRLPVSANALETRCFPRVRTGPPPAPPPPRLLRRSDSVAPSLSSTCTAMVSSQRTRVYPPPPPPTSVAVSKVMRANRGTDSKPERELRSALHRRGLRFRKDVRPPGAPCRVDVLFPTAKVAVFVDGCFWHRCHEHGGSPRSHSDYWQAKLDRNVARDRANDLALADAGWHVVRVWEHEPPEIAADRVAKLVRRRSIT